MDHTCEYQLARKVALAQGVTKEQYDKAETWYYDETDNVKHLVLLPNKKVNATENTCFVLGGVQADNTIKDVELYTVLGKEPGRELKSTKDLKGDFIDILLKENMRRVLDLVVIQGWHVHFMMLQVWYFAFVDIVDSINDREEFSFALKAFLYRVLKTFPDDTVYFLGKYRYPDIKEEDKNAFLDSILALTQKYLPLCRGLGDFMGVMCLMDCLENAKSKKKLVFIQDETPDEWVTWFRSFYRTEIASYPTKTLVFDTEKQVEKAIKEEPIEVNGAQLSNFRFEDSASNPMIQVCDYIVCILRKYFVFLDRTIDEVRTDITTFNETQMGNFRLLNKVMKDSLDCNPLFFHYIASIETQRNINQLMVEYGVRENLS